MKRQRDVSSTAGLSGSVVLLRPTRFTTGTTHQCRQPAHRYGDLVAGFVLRKNCGPGHDRGNPKPALEQLGFPARERPRIRKALAAVIARKDHDRVFGEAI